MVPEPDLVDAVRAMVERLDVVSAERIRDELDKLLLTPDPAAGLRFLVDTGLSDRFLPELAGFLGRAPGTLPPTAPAPDGGPLVRLATILVGGGRAAAAARVRALKYSRHDVDHVAGLVEIAESVVDHAGDVDRRGRPSARSPAR